MADKKVVYEPLTGKLLYIPVTDLTEIERDIKKLQDDKADKIIRIINKYYYNEQGMNLSSNQYINYPPLNNYIGKWFVILPALDELDQLIDWTLKFNPWSSGNQIIIDVIPDKQQQSNDFFIDIKFLIQNQLYDDPHLIDTQGINYQNIFKQEEINNPGSLSEPFNFFRWAISLIYRSNDWLKNAPILPFNEYWNFVNDSAIISPQTIIKNLADVEAEIPFRQRKKMILSDETKKLYTVDTIPVMETAVVYFNGLALFQETSDFVFFGDQQSIIITSANIGEVKPQDIVLMVANFNQ